MARLDEQKEKELTPIRYDFAMKSLKDLGFHPEGNGVQLSFEYKGENVTLFAYSGWHTGKTIKDGRGISKLLKQLK